MSPRRIQMWVGTMAVLLMIVLLIPLDAGQAQTPAAPATTPAAMSATTPSVTVKDQALTDNRVIIDTVVSDGPGWLVIHAAKGNTVGDVIGWAAVASGSNSNVVVAFSDPSKVTPTLYAMLHVDKGAVGKYEFPGADVPAMAGGQMVNPPFKITGGMMPAPAMSPAAATPSSQ